MKNNNQFSSATTIDQAFRHILLQQFKAIKKWQKIAIKGEDPEGVHHLRISLRRIRTTLVIFKPVINTKFSRFMAKRLKKYAKSLDNARDLDVFILTHFNDDISSSLKSAAIAQRTDSYQHVRKLLKSKQFNKRIHAYKKWVKTSRWHKPSIKHKKLTAPLESFAATTLDSLINLIIIQGEHPELLDDLALHHLRIMCKKLRYTIEFFKSLYDKKETKLFITQLKQLQDSLGEIHDYFIQEQLHQRLLKINPKIEVTSESRQLIMKIDQHSQAKKIEISDYLSNFCQSKYPWQV